MILPIVPYGNPILRQETEPVTTDSPELQRLLDDMAETMRNAKGIGLAAPQVGRKERVFVVDLDVLEEDGEGFEAVAEAAHDGVVAFINPEVTEPSEEAPLCDYEEGCLSIPDIRENVRRPETVRVRFLDRELRPHEVTLDGTLARVVQHETDHLDGILFLDHLSALRRRLLQRRLKAIARGEGEAEYPLASPSRLFPA
jgi:peptide deformylase